MRKSVTYGLVGFLAAASAAALAWRAFGLGYVESRIAETLAEQGVPVNALTLKSVGAGQAVLVDLRFALAGGVAIRRVEADYRLVDLLWNRRLDRLVLSGVRVDLIGPEAGSAVPVERAAPGWLPTGLPVDSIVLRDGEIAIAAPIGQLGVGIDLEAHSAADGGITLAGRTRLHGAAGELGTPFSGSIARDGAFSLTVTPESGRLVWGGANLENPEGTIALAGTPAGITLFDADLAADLALPDGSAGRIAIRGRTVGDSGSIDLELVSATTQGRANLKAEVVGWDGPSPAIDVTLQAELPLFRTLAAPTGRADAGWIAAGVVNASLSGTWDRGQGYAQTPLGGRLIVEAEITSAKAGSPVSVDLTGDLEAGADLLRLRIDDPSGISWQPDEPAGAQSLTLGDSSGGPVDMTAGRASDGWVFTVAGPFRLADRHGALSGTVDLAASGSQTETGQAGRIAAEVAASGSVLGVASVERGRAELAGSFSVGDGRWQFQPEFCLPVRAEYLQIGPNLSLPDGLSACWFVPPEPPLPAYPSLDGAAVTVAIRTDPVAMLIDTGAAEGLRIGLDPADLAIATRVEPDGSVSAVVTSPGFILRLPSHEAVALETVALSLESAAGGLPPLRLTLDDATLSSLHTPAWVSPLRLGGEAVLGADDLLVFDATIRGAAGALTATVEGRHDLASGAGSAGIRLDPVSFAPGVRQPTDIVPALAEDLVGDVTGAISAGARIGWRDGVSSSGTVRVEDLTLTSRGVTIRGMEGMLRADSLLPLNLPDGQLLAFEGADLGLVLEEGAMAFGLAGDRLAVQGIGFSLAGGSLAVDPFQAGPDDPELHLVVTMRGVELGPLSAQFPIEGLTVTGRLDGEIPIRLFDDTISIENGILETTEPGVIRYIATLPVGQPSEGGIGLLIGAVRNFHYEGLRATLNGRTGDDLEVAVRLTGANPDLYDGYPIALNINLSGELEEVLRSGLNSMAIADDAGSLLRGE